MKCGEAALAEEKTEPSPVCWICLEEDCKPSPCKCPSFVHRTCLARWQLERLGKREERECRFCSSILPPWQETLLPQRVKPAPEAVVNVHAPDGSLHRIPLRPGLAGRRRFLRAVRQALCLPAHAQLEMSFEVAVPSPTGCPSSAPTRINTRDFSLASHIATVNAGIRRANAKADQSGPEQGRQEDGQQQLPTEAEERAPVGGPELQHGSARRGQKRSRPC